MNDGFGIEKPARSGRAEHREPARYLVLIEAAGSTVARLFSPDRRQVSEFDAGSEEVAQMTQGLNPAADASGAEWDAALGSHNLAERRAADVYTLDV